MTEADVLKNMILAFRVSELTMLLNFAGRNKSGRKTELQQRALELVKTRNTNIIMKIKELYKSIQYEQQQNAALSQVTAPSYSTSSLPISSSRSSSHYNLESDRSSGMHTRSSYSGVPYPSYSTSTKSSSGTLSSSSAPVPVLPDVKLKKLAFYDVLGELLRPSSLVPQGSSRCHDAKFVFHLTPQQATDIASSRDMRPSSKLDYLNQIQLRFCLLETSCEQEDCFPSNVMVKVNGKVATLPNPIPTNKPGVEPKRPPRPVNITSLCRLSPLLANEIAVTWNSEVGRGFCVAAYLVRKLSSDDLLQRLKNKGKRASEYTKGLIKDKLAEDNDMEIATTSLQVSLMCPLGKMRMALPCRSSLCQHLQCFDASLFLQMNERKPTWVCPVCDKPVSYDNLCIDAYFSEVLSSTLLPKDAAEVQLLGDGSWSAVALAKKAVAAQVSKPVAVETVAVDDLELIDSPPAKKRAMPVSVITLSDSDDDDASSQKSTKDLKRSDSCASASSVSSTSAPTYPAFDGQGASQVPVKPARLATKLPPVVKKVHQSSNAPKRAKLALESLDSSEEIVIVYDKLKANEKNVPVKSTQEEKVPDIPSKVKVIVPDRELFSQSRHLLKNLPKASTPAKIIENESSTGRKSDLVHVKGAEALPKAKILRTPMLVLPERPRRGRLAFDSKISIFSQAEIENFASSAQLVMTVRQKGRN